MQSILSYETCFSVAATFSVRKDFRAKAYREYQWLKRNGLMDQACAHMVILRRDLGDGDIAKIASQYTHRRAFKLADQSAYQSAIKRGILDSVCAHMEVKNRVIDRDMALDQAKKYNSRSDFKTMDGGCYFYASKNGFLEESCAHMGDPLPSGFRDDKPATLYQYRIETSDGLVLYKVGITNRKPRERMMTMGIQSDAKVELMNFTEFEAGRDARMTEKELHRLHSSHRYAGLPVMKNGNTELFTVPIF